MSAEERPPGRWRTCLYIVLFAYSTRFLAFATLWQPAVRAGFYISLPHSHRQRHVLGWVTSQNARFPMVHVAGVLVDKAEYARLRALRLAPDTRGQAGCRRAHLNVLHNISAQAVGWYLVVEDDVDGSLAHATALLQWLVALVPNVQAVNLYSPTVRRWPQPLPIFNTRTTGYFVTPMGAALMIDAIERRPDLHVDEALAPIQPTLHWLLFFFCRGWVFANGLARNDNMGTEMDSWKHVENGTEMDAVEKGMHDRSGPQSLSTPTVHHHHNTTRAVARVRVPSRNSSHRPLLSREDKLLTGSGGNATVVHRPRLHGTLRDKGR